MTKLSMACGIAALFLAACGPSHSDDGGSTPTTESIPDCDTQAGATTTLYSGGVTGLAAVGSDLYVTSYYTIVKVSMLGDAPVELASLSYAYGLAVLGRTGYFNGDQNVGVPDPQGKQQTEETLAAIPLDGGSATNIVVDQPPTVGESLVGVDDASLYFAQWFGQPWSVGKLTPPATTIAALPVNGKPLINAIVVHGNDLFVAGMDLSIADVQKGVVQRIGKSGGDVQVVLSGIGTPHAMAVDDSNLYLAVDPPDFNSSGSIVKTRLDGSSPTTLVEAGAGSIAVANGFLYYAAESKIWSLPVAGGTPNVLADGLKAPGMLRVVGGNLVWVDPVSKAMSDPTVPVVQTTCR